MGDLLASLVRASLYSWPSGSVKTPLWPMSWPLTWPTTNTTSTIAGATILLLLPPHFTRKPSGATLLGRSGHPSGVSRALSALCSLHSAWQVGRQQKSTSRSGRSQSCVRGAEWVAAAPGAVWREARDGWDASQLQHKLDCTTSLLIFPLHALNYTASTRLIQSYLSTRY